MKLVNVVFDKLEVLIFMLYVQFVLKLKNIPLECLPNKSPNYVK